MKHFITILKKWAHRLWPAAFWLLCWYAAAKIMNQPILLVTPGEALLRFWEMLQTPAFWSSIAYSCGHILLGFVLAALGSILLAGAAHRLAFLRRLFAPLVTVVKVVPVASFVVLVLFWTSSRRLSVIISAMIAFPVIYTSCLASLDQLSQEMKEVRVIFRISPIRYVRYIAIPQMLPTLSAALCVALGMCFKSGIAAEIIGIPAGSVGEGLYQAKIYLNSADLFAWTLAIIGMSMLWEAVLRLLLRWIEKSGNRWRA